MPIDLGRHGVQLNLFLWLQQATISPFNLVYFRIKLISIIPFVWGIQIFWRLITNLKVATFIIVFLLENVIFSDFWSQCHYAIWWNYCRV